MSKSAPLVSVVIPTYKREFSFVERAINSVLEQTYQNIEIIVVSDNDKGSLWAIDLEEGIKKYPSVRLIQVEKNAGAPAARNLGMSEAKGELIGFLDDDDLWLSRKIEVQVPFFDDPDVALVFCGGYLSCENQSGKLFDYWTHHSLNKSTKVTFDRMLVYDVIGTTSQAMIRGSIVPRLGGFDISMKSRQDYEFWLRILKFYKAAGTSEQLFIHITHLGEQISGNSRKGILANNYIYLKYLDDFEKNPKACFFVRYRQAELYFQKKQYIQGMFSLIRGLFTYVIKWVF